MKDLSYLYIIVLANYTNIICSHWTAAVKTSVSVL